MPDVKLHGKGIRKDFRSKNIEIFCTEKQDRLTGKNENVFSYGQVGNRPSLAFAECLTKCGC